MNITLLIVIVILILGIVNGYKRGMAKEISGLIALIATIFVLALLLMLYSSFQAGETTNTLYSIILLVLLGIVYGIVKLILKSAKAVSKLPIINLVDHLLGTVIGAMKAVIFIWIVFMLCTNIYMGPITPVIRADIETSTFLKILYSYNFLVG